MQKRDLTSGSVAGNLVYMAVPTMLGFMARTLYDLVDMVWVGRISAEAVAGITIFATVYWLAFVLNNIIGVSSVSMISQSYGAGDMQRTNRVVEQVLVFKALMAIIASIIVGFMLQPLLAFFTKDAAVLREALAYGRIRLFFLPVMFSSLTVGTALRCTGDSKRSMYIMLMSAVLNIILDPILIFDKIPFIGLPGFGLGVFGAALATEISAACAFVFGAWMLFSGRSFVRPSLKGLLRLDWEIDRKLISIGLPTGVESLLRNMAQFFILRFVAVYGTVAVAALGIVHRLLGFAFMPLEGLMQGGSTIVGQNLGNNNVLRAEQTAKAASLLGSISMVGFTLIAISFPRQILSIFVQDPAVIQIGCTALYVIMPSMIFAGIMLGLATVFGGSGYNLPFMISGMVARWGVQLPFLLVTVSWLKLPFVWVAASFLAGELAEFTIIMIAYRQGKWRTARVVDAPVSDPAAEAVATS